MGKVVKAVATVVGVAAAFIPVVGVGISAAMISAGIGASTAVAITAALSIAGVTSAIGLAAKAVGLGPKAPKQSPASAERLRATLDPRAFRKIVFGHTAAATDVHYQEFTGADQEYLNSIVVIASHAVEEIEQVWFDEKLAWSASGGVATEFSGYLTVTAIEEGTTANAFTISGSTSWTAGSSRLVGNAYLLLRYKLTGNTKKAESPFASGVSSRITVRVKGAKLYDPRLDSTVAGGSGSHRADDQTTWGWVSDDVGRNLALQELWYLLGWRIQNPADSSWTLAVGLGLPPSRIDLPGFIAAANLCDEDVTLAAGGTEPRYRGDGVFSEGDDPSLVFENLNAGMNALLRDAGGKLALDVLHNDLATPVVDLTEADVIGDFTWLQTPPIDQSFNTVRGRYVDASDASLYQMADYPDVSIAALDGIERVRNLDLPVVQSAGQAQRLAKQFLQRAQFPGTFTADFLASAWRCQVGSVIRLTFPALGWTNKLFRVVEHAIRDDGTCPMTLREENAAIYAWDAEESPAVVAAGAQSYDPLNEPWQQAISETEAKISVIRTAGTRNPRDASDVARDLFTASDAGATATISVAKHETDYPPGTPDTTRALGTITGLAFNTVYFIYFDDATLTDTAPTYHATTDTKEAVNSSDHPDRHPLGSIRTPVDGGSSTTSDGVAPTYGNAAALVLLQAIKDGPSRIATTVTDPTVPSDGTALDYTARTDGAVNAVFQWTYPAADEKTISYFEILWLSRTSASAYTPGTTPAAEERLIVMPNVRAITRPGMAADLYHTAAVRAVRVVDPDIATGGANDSPGFKRSAWVKSTASGENPWQPSTDVSFLGKINTTAASSIETWATRASLGLNSDGSVQTGQVGTLAIASKALLSAGYGVSSTLIVLATSDLTDQALVSSHQVLASRVIVKFEFGWSIGVTNPTQGTKYTITVRAKAQNLTTLTDYYSDTITLEEEWQRPNYTGSADFARRYSKLEFIFAGAGALPTGYNYKFSFEVATPAGNGASLIGARGLRAEDRRAPEA